MITDCMDNSDEEFKRRLDEFNSKYNNPALSKKSSTEDIVEDLAKVRAKAKEIAQSADLQGQPTLAEKNIRHVMNNYNPSYKELHEITNEALEKVTSYDEYGFAGKVHKILSEIEEMLISKNAKYGDSVLNPNQIFSKASKIEQINVRIDDKLNRIKNRSDDEDEDVDGDLIGYLVLRKIAKMK
jgi:uncharacterized protein YdiU (UPF0061 family)